jgi:predicted outer membrane repeat protein
MKFLLPILSKRFFILFALLILSVFQIPSSASAATITVSTTSDAVIGDCTTVCTFRDAIASSTDGDTIVFADDVRGTITLGDTIVRILHNLSITGPGAELLSIDGDGGSLLYISQSASTLLTISGLTFQNFGSPGVIYSSGDIVISDSVFQNNVGSGYPGGIYLDGGNLTIDDSIFSNNSSNYAGVIQFESAGDLIINNSDFINNSSYTNGGAIYVSSGNFTITDSTFTGNSATSSGGAIYHNSSGDLEISGSTFTENIVGESGGYGGAINSSSNNFSITDSTFTGNTGDGGAGIVTSGTNLTISSSTFSGNVASGISDYGGAILAYSDNVSITDSTFTNNTINNPDGGAIYGEGIGEFTISSSTFTGNISDNNGGALYLESYATSTITNSTFTDNESGINGGAIFTASSVTNLTVTSSTFDGNTSVVDGGAIEFQGGEGANLEITNSTFVNNVSNGGAYGIINESDNGSTASITNSTFFNNSVPDGYGILSLYGTNSVINSIFVSNTPGVCDSATSGGHNIIDGNSCDADFIATGDITSTNPLLDTVNGLADNGGPVKTIALLPNSPAINAGNDESAPLTDARGYARVGISDIGAYEYQPPVVVPPATSPTPTPSRVSGSRRRIVSTTQSPAIPTAPTPSTPSNNPTKTLTTGSKGQEVKTLQTILNILGYNIAKTGPGSKGNETDLFGNLTKQALIKFQLAHNITPAVGNFGPKTQAVLIQELKKVLEGLLNDVKTRV